MASQKRKIKFIAKSAAVIAVPLALLLVVTNVMYSMKDYMNQWLGAGEMHTVSANGLSTEYIDFECSARTDAEANELGVGKGSRELAQKITQQVAEEGITLLKNDDNALPLAKKAKVTLLGYYGWHNNMAGGEDPATTEGAVSLYKGIEAQFDCNPNVTSDGIYARGELSENEVESTLDAQKASYSDYDTAIITLKRNSGEGNDQTVKLGNAENGRTGLTINRAEMKLIDYANKNFKKVIVIVNAANTMELGFLDNNDPNISTKGDRKVYHDPYSDFEMDVTNLKGAYWAGCCGSQGGKAIANLLDGTVNPSGHTPDIYARDLRDDPTYNNFGSFEYSNSASLNSYANASFFVNYEEDIYIGYRYHETAAYEASKNNYTTYNYNNAVVYPFGYGLSYTNFTYAYEGEPTYDATNETFTFKVKVTNNGSVAGKGVAQIYVNVPYATGEVEKAHVVLGGFAKTSELESGKSETVTIEVKKDYYSSYDYVTEKAYVLDKGDYNFILASDDKGSHSWASADMNDSTKVYKYTEASKVVYNEAHGKRTTDEKVATNVMDDETNYMFEDYTAGNDSDGKLHRFTRSNFQASFPKAPSGDDYVMTDSRAKKMIAKYDVWADSEQNGVDEDGNAITEMPETNTDKTSYSLIDMRGVDFDDEKWDDYINQFTVDSMAYMFSNGGWQAPADKDNGVPLTVDCDSPYGYYAFGSTFNITERNTWYCGAPMVAATFNTDLAKRLGEVFGEEAWCQNKDGRPITGIYGFGMNQHRSAFGGRNYEYYSEDPVLCGKIGMSEASGASSKGLIVYMKHFVTNDQETNRQANGYCSWVDEQALREVYLRAWEIYIKEAKMDVKYNAYNEETGAFEMKTKKMSAATGMMTCYNRIGATYGGASPCINGILRNEWKFTGTIVTDAGGEPDTYMTTDLALRRGQNLTLTNNGTQGLYDTTSKTAVWWLKNSTKYLLYNKANSNIMCGMSADVQKAYANYTGSNSIIKGTTAMTGVAPGDKIYYDRAPWENGVVAVWVVYGVLAAAIVVVDVLVGFDKIHLKEKVKSADDEFDY